MIIDETLQLTLSEWLEIREPEIGPFVNYMVISYVKCYEQEIRDLRQQLKDIANDNTYVFSNGYIL